MSTAKEELFRQTTALCNLIESAGFKLLPQDVKDRIHAQYQEYVKACLDLGKDK